MERTGTSWCTGKGPHPVLTPHDQDIVFLPNHLSSHPHQAARQNCLFKLINFFLRSSCEQNCWPRARPASARHTEDLSVWDTHATCLDVPRAPFGRQAIPTLEGGPLIPATCQRPSFARAPFVSSSARFLSPAAKIPSYERSPPA